MDSKTETRGRKRFPEGKHKPPQATVKINNIILPFVRELKGNLKKGVVTSSILSQLFSVLQGESEQQTSIFKDPEVIGIVKGLQDKIYLLEAETKVKDTKIAGLKENLKERIVKPITVNERSLLKKQYDDEHSKAIQLEGKVRNMESTISKLKNDYDILFRREYNCMAIKGNGERCSKRGMVDLIQEGINIHVCLQHSKVLANKEKQ